MSTPSAPTRTRRERSATMLIPLLAQLDEGIQIYRRSFGTFLLITLSWFVPAVVAAGLLIAYASWRDDFGIVLVGLAAAAVLVPLFIYLIGGLSRAAAAADQGQPVRLRAAFALSPLRVFSMLIFTVVYYVLAQIVTSVISMVCICPAYFAVIFLAAGAASTGSSAGFAALGLFAVVFVVIYVLLLAISGATYSSLIYAIQPWAHEQRPFGELIQQSLDLIGYRFGRNLIAWLVSSLLVGVVGLSVTLVLGLVLPLPLTYVLGSESPITIAVSAAAWLIGVCVALPPLPIWMTLLYRRNLAARSGADLEAKVRAWSAASEPGTI